MRAACCLPCLCVPSFVQCGVWQPVCLAVPVSLQVVRVSCHADLVQVHAAVGAGAQAARGALPALALRRHSRRDLLYVGKQAAVAAPVAVDVAWPLLLHELLLWLLSPHFAIVAAAFCVYCVDAPTWLRMDRLFRNGDMAGAAAEQVLLSGIRPAWVLVCTACLRPSWDLACWLPPRGSHRLTSLFCADSALDQNWKNQVDTIFGQYNDGKRGVYRVLANVDMVSQFSLD